MKNNLQKKNIPDGWKFHDLLGVAEFLDNKRVPIESQERATRKGNYPYYGASGIIDYVNDYIFDGEFVLLGEDGANIIDRSSRLAYIARGKIWVNNHAHVLKPKANINLYYLSEYLEKINYEMYNTGSAQPKLNRTVCEKIPVLLPPLLEQNRIVAVLEAWDKAIEKLEKKIEIKKKIKNGLMQNLLTGKKRIIGFKEDWQTVNLKEICTIYDGTHQTPLYVEKGIPFYSVEHVTANDFNNTKYISEEVYENEIKKVRIEKGDILMTRIGSIGAIKYVDWDVKASFYVTLALLKVNKKIDSRALSFFLIAKKFQDEVYGRTLHVAFPNKINLGDIGMCKIDLPKDINEQIAIASILDNAEMQIFNLKKKLVILKEQKKFLLNNLVTGAIRTPEDLKVN